MNILHLSDIHFGRNHHISGEPFSRKSEILDKLIETIATLDDAMKPDLVLVTGDIAWHGVKSDFDEAFTWFQRLRTSLDLKPDQFVFCPGNHDLNRNTAVDFTEKELLNSTGSGKIDISKCDYFYEYEQAHILEARFHNYNLFCEQMGMQPYSYMLSDGTKEYSYLIGSSRFEFGGKTYVIACFNTAYLPYGEVLNDDQMFLGLPQIQNLLNTSVLSSEADDIYRIALFHHADRFLHPNEQCEYDNRKASLPLLLNSVDLALCGHTETGGMPVLRSYQDGGSLLSGGAAYYNDSHPNSFSLIKLEKGNLPQVCSFYFDGNSWKRFSDDSHMAWETQHSGVIWTDSIHARKQLGFGAQIDGSLDFFYYGYFDMVPTETPSGIMLLPNNRINPARSVDIWAEVDPDNSLTARLGMRPAPAQQQSIESLILFTRCNNFIAAHIQNATQAFSGWYDINNQLDLVACAPMDVPKVAKAHIGHRSNLDTYLAIQQIEEYFRVKFRFPAPGPTKNDIQVIHWLMEIMDIGSLNLEIGGIGESFFVVHSREEIKWLHSVSKTGKPLVYHFERKIMIKFFGTQIKLGECDLYFIGAKSNDLLELQRKIATWEEGDVRRIETCFPENISFWLVPKKYREHGEGPQLDGLFTAHFPSEAPLFFNETLQEYFLEY